VAVSLRWGSYFAFLADPARPDAPNIDDGQVSQIDDEEMARMNIEISADVAWWLTLADSDDRRYADLVARALAYLLTGRKTVSAMQAGDMLLASTVPEMAAEVHRQWSADRLERDMQTAANHGIRVIANTITHSDTATADSLIDHATSSRGFFPLSCAKWPEDHTLLFPPFLARRSRPC
jgi:hypothetical protein